MRTPIPRYLPAFLCLSLLLALVPDARGETAHLTVLHTTDLHGSLSAAAGDLPGRGAAGGLARIATLVREVRAEGRPVLLLDGGDAIQGGAIVGAYRRGDRARPEPMMTAMTRLGYEAMAVGNHEFSYGPEALAAACAAAGFPWLAANAVRADGSPAFGTSIVREMGGVRVGVVGLTTPAIPSLEDSADVAGLRFLSPLEIGNAEAKRLREAERCDVVVVLAHTGLEQGLGVGGGTRQGNVPGENWGYRLARELKGVDLLVLGHTHETLAEENPPAGPLVVQAGHGGTTLGRVDLELARATPRDPWRLESRRSRWLPADDPVAVDTALAAVAAPYEEAAVAALAERLGTAAREIGSPRGRFAAGPLWDLIHAAQLEATGADVSIAALPDPAAVLRAGPVTTGDLVRVYPYDNTLAVVELTGDQLRQVLERSARGYAAYTFAADRPLLEPGAAPHHLQGAAGITYDVDLTRPMGERIVNLAWQGQPLDPGRKLKVAVNSYVLGGGGGYAEIVQAPRSPGRGPDVRDALAAHIRRLGTLDGATTHAWTVLPDYASCPERPLVDLLVRQGAVPRDEVMHLFPDQPARRADLGYWLARAFGWREKRLSGAFADAPDPLEPWLDGLLRRRVLGRDASQEMFQPFAVASLDNAFDWCTAAARAAGYATGDGGAAASFRRGLLTGTSLAGLGGSVPVRRDTLTVAQVLGLVANLRFPTVRVLETTDFHGALLAGAKERASGRAVGGSAVLAAWVAKLRAENPEGTVLVDGGDAFQGTMISNLQYGRPVVEQMNLLGYSAMAVGNHDFDWSADTLERRVDEMRFAAFGANMLERRTGRMPRWARSDTLLARRGLRVALFGLAYTGTPHVTLASNVARLRFADDSATAAALVPKLRRRTRPHLVVEIGHTPGGLDSARRVDGDLGRLARVPGVDLWMGGHSHNHLLGEVGGATVMIPGSQGQVVGVCDLTVDPLAGRVVERRARLQPTYADEVRPDSAMLTRVAGWNAGVAQLAATPIGQNVRALTRNRGGESVLGDLVTDAMRAESGADLAFTNSGGLRADLPAGPITRGSVYDVMPFDNTIVLVKLTGAAVHRMLEDGLAHGRVSPQSGLRYRFDLSRPEGSRLVAATLADGSPLDEARTYTVAVNNFMASGGDNYDTLGRAGGQVDTGILVRDALERYLVARTKDAPLDLEADGRIEGTGGDRP